jgi:hypothetical protein
MSDAMIIENLSIENARAFNAYVAFRQMLWDELTQVRHDIGSFELI